MIDIIKYLKVIFKNEFTIKLYDDELPNNFGFNENKLGAFYMMENGIDEESNCDYDLQIHLVGKLENKLYLLEKIDRIDKKLNNAFINNKSRIFKKNVFLNHYTDEGKHVFILEYYVRNFKL